MPLNVRQRSFARLAAEGVKLTEAHEKAYGKGNGKRKTKHEEASKLAAKPEVKAAIAEFEAQLIPIGDLQACKQRMLANLQSLALYSRDEKVRLAATINLREYIEAREERERDRKTVTVDALIREIGQLQAPAEPELELETVSDEDAQAAAQEQAADTIEASTQDAADRGDQAAPAEGDGDHAED